jgi:putative Ig domain-containing protein
VLRSVAAVSAVALLSLLPTRPHAQTPSPSAYDAVTDRGPRAKPTLIKLGAAGVSFNDPVFGTRVWRVTDRLTRPTRPDRSYRTPSATHQNAWSADESRFYVVSTDGTVLPFAFDPSLGVAMPLDPLTFYIEPQFSYVNPSLIFGAVNAAGASLRTIDQYDFSTGGYKTLLDLDAVAPGLQGTYVGGVSSSAGSTERVMAFFGGASQDRHHYVVVFDRAQPQTRHVLDSTASTIDGRNAPVPLNFHLHHAAIDRSGRFVMLYPTGDDIAPPRAAAQVYVWALDTGTIVALPVSTAHSGGHDAFGYGTAINQDCCTSTSWDAAQWQFRTLIAPLATRDLITPPLRPTEVYLADHPTWNNAQPDRLVPFITATYRYGTNAVEWRPWDDEIIGVETDPDGGNNVWRFAHHRSDVRNDQTPSQLSFWYTPRPNVSPDGRWVLFTSNWEKTLGTDPQGASGESARQDVFLLRLKSADGEDALPPPLPLEIITAAIPDAKLNTPYAFMLQATRFGVTWSVTRGALPRGLTLDPSGRIGGTPSATGGMFCEISAADGTATVSKAFLIRVRR